MRLRQYLAQYVLDRSLTPGTVQGYETAIDQFAEFVGDKAVTSLTLQEVVTWGEHLMTVAKSPRTVASKVKAVMSVLRAAKGNDPDSLDGRAGIAPDEPDEPPRPTWHADPATMTLPDCLRQYCLEHALAESSAQQLAIIVRQFGAFAGEKLLVEITSDDVNRWVQKLAKSNAPRTVKGKLANLKTLLTAGRDALDLPPLAKLRRIKAPKKNPDAFSPEDVAKLIGAAEKLRRWCPLTGLRRGDWWIAFLMSAWDTAIRLGDLLNLRFSNIRRDTLLVSFTQHKTGNVHTCRLRPETWQAVQVIAGQGDRPRELVFPWGASRYQFYVGFRELCDLVGLKGTSKYLRRGRATQEAKRGGAGAAAIVLGHTDLTGFLAQSNYIDARQLDSKVPLAPALPLPPSVLKRLPAVPDLRPLDDDDDDEPGIDDTAIESGDPAPATNGHAPDGAVIDVVVQRVLAALATERNGERPRHSEVQSSGICPPESRKT